MQGAYDAPCPDGAAAPAAGMPDVAKPGCQDVSAFIVAMGALRTKTEATNLS